MCLVCSQLNDDVGVLCLCLRTRAAFLLVFGLFNVMWVVLNHAPGGSIGRVFCDPSLDEWKRLA